MSTNQEGATALQVGRIGLIGAVIGALIGGIGSFAGSYLTYQQQRDIRANDTKRAAYIAVMTKGIEYDEALFVLKEAAGGKDESKYTKAWEQLYTIKSRALYDAVVSVSLLPHSKASEAAIKVAEAYFPVEDYLKPAMKDFDKEAWSKVRKEGNEALNNFHNVARADLE